MKRLPFLIAIIVILNVLIIYFLYSYEFTVEVGYAEPHDQETKTEIEAIAKAIIEGREQEGRRIIRYEVVPQTRDEEWYWNVLWWETEIRHPYRNYDWGGKILIGELIFWSLLTLYLIIHYAK
jgi:hypothetical protein